MGKARRLKKRGYEAGYEAGASARARQREGGKNEEELGGREEDGEGRGRVVREFMREAGKEDARVRGSVRVRLCV
eukprot:804753-Pleurochrysis_carterae.AAC.1